MNKLSRNASILAAAGLLAGTVYAQAPDPEVAVFDFVELENEQTVDAKIVEMHPEERTLMVEIEPTDEMTRLIVPENADIIMEFPNDIEREIELSDLHVGDSITLEGHEVEGAFRVRIVSFDS
jgi:hypothetical protein